MEEGRPSRTAFAAASHRAVHRLFDEARVFDDPHGVAILGPGAEAHLRANVEAHQGLSRFMRALIVGRSRVAEDALAAAAAKGVDQYVLLGSGLDTFAYRNPFPALKVFEVDFPATQAWKREWVANAGIPVPDSLTYAPVNFEHETLAEGLARAGVDATRPTIFAWLGVVPYLTREAIMANLAVVAGFPAGSAIIFDYAEPRENLSPVARAIADERAKRVAEMGEPWLSFFQPADLAADLRRIGFSELEDLDGPALNARYFAGTDLGTGPTTHVMRAVV